MSDQTPNEPPSAPGPPPSAPPPPPSAPPAGGYSSAPPSYSSAQPVPAGPATNSAPDIFTATFMMNNAPPPAGWQPKQKMIAGILAILLGGLGVHSFYLGNTKKGIFQILSNILCLGGIWGIIDGIMIFIGNAGTDAYGVPLTE